MEIRRSYDGVISTTGFPILVRRHLYIESGPRSFGFKEIGIRDTMWCLVSIDISHCYQLVWYMRHMSWCGGLENYLIEEAPITPWSEDIFGFSPDLRYFAQQNSWNLVKSLPLFMNLSSFQIFSDDIEWQPQRLWIYHCNIPILLDMVNFTWPWTKLITNWWQRWYQNFWGV